MVISFSSCASPTRLLLPHLHTCTASPSLARPSRCSAPSLRSLGSSTRSPSSVFFTAFLHLRLITSSVSLSSVCALLSSHQSNLFRVICCVLPFLMFRCICLILLLELISHKRSATDEPACRLLHLGPLSSVCCQITHQADGPCHYHPTVSSYIVLIVITVILMLQLVKVDIYFFSINIHYFSVVQQRLLLIACLSLL